jgi:hypothetical protein
MAGMCMSKGAALAAIVGIAVFCIFILTAVLTAVYHLVIRRQASSGSSSYASGYRSGSSVESNVSKPGNNETSIVDMTVHRIPQEYFWQETGSDLLVADYDDDESYSFI